MAALVRRAGLRFLARHPWQIFLAVLGVALGVAVVVAVGLADTSAMRAFRLSSKMVAGSATDRIIGGPAGIDERLYTRLRVDEGIETCAPMVDGYVEAGGLTLHVLGIDPFADTESGGPLAGTGAGIIRQLLVRPGTVLLAPRTARHLHLRIGKHFIVHSGGRDRHLVLAGLLSAARTSPADDSFLVTDISTAQILTGQIGRLSSISLTLPSGRAGTRLRARIAAILPVGTRILPAQARTTALVQMTRAFRTNLTAMSLLALIVGMFLIYNTMTFAVLQRRPLIGTLRAIGVTRGEIFGTVLVEALILGIIGTVAGLAMGMVLATGLLHLVARTINDLYFVVSVTGLLVTPGPLVKGAVLGIGTTVLASLVPAIEASVSTPGAAMRRSMIEQLAHAIAPRLALVGGALVAAALLVLPLPTRSLVSGFAVLFMITIGSALIAPQASVWLASGAGALLQTGSRRPGHVLGRLALRGITASLSRTGVAIAALMLAVATTVGVGVMVQSLRTTVRQWLDSTLRADIYVAAPALDPAGTPPPIDPRIITGIARIPGISAISSARRAIVESGHGTTQILAVDFPAGNVPRFQLSRGDAPQAWAAFDANRAVLVSQSYAYRRRISVGAHVRLLTRHGYRSLPVSGVFYDYGSEQGTILMHRQLYEHEFGDHGISSLGLYLQPGTSTQTVIGMVRAVAAHRQALIVRSNRALRSESIRVFDRAFAITGVLRTLAVLIAAIGILSALMALQLERTREIAILRATGLTPGQIMGLVTVQSGFVGLCSGLLAIPSGLTLALLLIHVINRRAFGWTMQTRVTPSVLVEALILSVAAAIAADLPGMAHGAHQPGRRPEGGVAMRRLLAWLLPILAAAALAIAFSGHGTPENSASPDLQSVLDGGNAAGYARAMRPRAFHFPHDFGPHRSYRTEWWYFTGNLHSRQGRRFGYELTVFRFSIAPHPVHSASRWSTNQVYVAHLAVTDPARSRFRFFSQAARGAAGLAGSQAMPFRVWVNNWSIRSAGGSEWPWLLRASAKGVRLHLQLVPLLAPVLQGDDGLSRKGPAPGNASYYYSIPRLKTRGTLSVDGRSFPVSGLTWMDREWSTSALPSGVAGWDWFGLQLSDGSDLMFYRLRTDSGATGSFSQGSLVEPDGTVLRLAADDLRIQVLAHWHSPHGGTYPARWKLIFARAHLALEVTPVLADQELDVGVRYWEGAVNVQGVHDGHPVRGEGYVELTGYAPSR